MRSVSLELLPLPFGSKLTPFTATPWTTTRPRSGVFPGVLSYCHGSANRVPVAVVPLLPGVYKTLAWHQLSDMTFISWASPRHSAPLHAWRAGMTRTGLDIRCGAETLGIMAVFTSCVPGVYPIESHTARRRKRECDG